MHLNMKDLYYDDLLSDGVGMLLTVLNVGDVCLCVCVQVGRIPFNKQLEYFTNTKSQFVQLLGEQATADILSKSLFSIILGANDYLNNYYQPLSPVGNLTPEQLSTMLVNNFTAQLTVSLHAISQP